MSNFDGKSSCSDYLVQFQVAARLNHWSEEEKAMELATSLECQARRVLSDMSEQDRLDYGALVQKLSLRFEPVDLIWMYQSQLRSRKRKHNESLPELAQEMGNLTRQAFPAANETTCNYMVVTSFISALGNKQQEVFVYQTDPKTVEEAGNAAMAFEMFQAEQDSLPPHAVWPTTLHGWTPGRSGWFHQAAAGPDDTAGTGTDAKCREYRAVDVLTSTHPAG